MRSPKTKDKKREDWWPWMRDCSSDCYTPDDKKYFFKYIKKHPKFYSLTFDNAYPDLSTKRAAIKASPSVVSVVTYSGDTDVFQGSGTIIEKNGTILTSADLIKCPSSGNVVANNIKVTVYLLGGSSYEAELLAYDLYYNIAIVKIQSEVLLEPAQLRLLDDFLPVDPNEELRIGNNRGFLRPHSDAYVLIPGDHVTALGRYFITPYDIMVAPGDFSITHCDSSYECKERFQSTCVITSTGVGGPLVNRYGEVIGIMMYECGFSPFLPINIALKWWDYFKRFRELRQRPLIGMELTTLYTVDMRVMSKVIQKLPGNYSGIYVEEVIQGSNADVAGILPCDLIVKCNGKTIRGLLEFYDIMWDNTGKSVELDVIRASCNAPLQLPMTVVEATQLTLSPASSKQQGLED